MGVPAGARPAFRLAGGVALAATVAFGLALPMGYLFILTAVMLLAPPSAPPGLKATAILLAIAMVVTLWGALLGPVLTYAPVAGVLIMLAGIALAVWLGFRPGLAIIGSLMILSHTIIAVIASQSSAAAVMVVQLSLGAIVTAVVIAHIMHTVLPDPNGARPAPPASVPPRHARWVAIRTALIMIGPILLALSNPATYILLLMKGSTLAAQVEEAHARRLGVETVSSTLLGSFAALAVWWLLKLWPGLPLLVLLLTLATLLFARPMYRAVSSRLPFTFWLNTLITMIILIGPAVADTASSADIQRKMLVRTLMFAALSIYAVIAVRILDALRPRSRTQEAIP